MTEPISWQAVQDIKAMIAGISVAGGYYTDLGAAPVVTDRSQVPLDGGNYVLVAAHEITRNEDASGPRTLISDMDLTIEFAIALVDNDDAEHLAHRARADLVRVLTTDLRDRTAGFRTLKITGSSITGSPVEGADYIVAHVTATAGLREDVTHPAITE